MDHLTSDQRSRVMSRIRATETGPERALRAALAAQGLRGWRKNLRAIAGVSSADVAFTRWKVAVFVDGAFWHGHPDHFTAGKSGRYWDSKIAGNIERDARTTGMFKRRGWRVIRAWDFEIERDIDKVTHRVRLAVEQRKRRAYSQFGA